MKHFYKQPDGKNLRPRSSVLQCERNTSNVCRFPYTLAGMVVWTCVERDGESVCPVANPAENNLMMHYPDTSSTDFRPCGMCPNCTMTNMAFHGHGLTNHQGWNTYSGLDVVECEKLCGVTKGCNYYNHHTDKKKCFLKFGVGRIKTGGSSLEVFGAGEPLKRRIY